MAALSVAMSGVPTVASPSGSSTGLAQASPSLEAVWAEHGPMVSRIVATYEADPACREELLQEVALAVWRALDRFEGRASLRTFLARIAHNRCVSHVAREARRVDAPAAQAMEEPAADGTLQPHQVVQAEQTYARLLGAVAALPLGPRQVMSLALEGFDQAEIADVLGITANNVGVRLSRARRTLREVLEG